MSFLFFFFNDTATTEIYTLSLHDALPISQLRAQVNSAVTDWYIKGLLSPAGKEGTRFFYDDGTTKNDPDGSRSEEHTSELQSRQYLVCRLLLEKKKKKDCSTITNTIGYQF